MKSHARLTRPLARSQRGAPLEATTWDHALDLAASGLRRIVDQHGPRSVGIFSCSKSTNEMNFIAGKFARVVLGTNNIDSCNRT